MEIVFCQDCGGKGYDAGSLYEPEECPGCLGSGKQLVDLSPSSSHYRERKPMGREVVGVRRIPSIAELNGGRYGD